MGLFSKKPSKEVAGASSATGRAAKAETIAHLRAFAEGHPGCEAYIEPPTRVTQTTMVIVAETGEWTRRRIPDEATAAKVAKDLGIPAFNVNLSGYPSRMREWNERQRKDRHR
jgi:hypothetical protein